MQTFLVTGAAGFIGSHSVEGLLARDCRVIGVDNLRTGHLENLEIARTSPRFEWILADASDEAAMRALARRFAETAAKRHIVLETCAEKIDLSECGVSHGRCVDGALFERLTGRASEALDILAVLGFIAADIAADGDAIAAAEPGTVGSLGLATLARLVDQPLQRYLLVVSLLAAAGSETTSR